MDKPKRKLNRLTNYDYSLPGTYFLTICTSKRQNYFWQTLDYPQDFKLSKYGEFVDAAIKKIPQAYSLITLEYYTIMPDHVHILLTIRDACGRALHAPTISKIVQQLKGFVTKQLGFSIWQKSFSDHVIRNDIDLSKHIEYINNNPLNWLLKNHVLTD